MPEAFGLPGVASRPRTPRIGQGDIREAAAVVLPASCRTCDVRVIGILSIMTSAVDIARHLFIPSLESNLFRRLLTING